MTCLNWSWTKKVMKEYWHCHTASTRPCRGSKIHILSYLWTFILSKFALSFFISDLYLPNFTNCAKLFNELMLCSRIICECHFSRLSFRWKYFLLASFKFGTSSLWQSLESLMVLFENVHFYESSAAWYHFLNWFFKIHVKQREPIWIAEMNDVHLCRRFKMVKLWFLKWSNWERVNLTFLPKKRKK